MAGIIEHLVEMEQRRALGEYALNGGAAPDSVAELEGALRAAERDQMLAEGRKFRRGQVVQVWAAGQNRHFPARVLSQDGNEVEVEFTKGAPVGWAKKGDVSVSLIKESTQQMSLLEFDMRSSAAPAKAAMPMPEMHPVNLARAVARGVKGAEYDKRQHIVTLKNGTKVSFMRYRSKSGDEDVSKMLVYPEGRKGRMIVVQSPREAVKKAKTLSERAVRVPAGFEPSNKLQKALLGLLRRASKAKGPGGWYRLDKLAMSGDLQGVPFDKVYYAAMALSDFGKLGMKELGRGKGMAVQLKESLEGEERPFDLNEAAGEALSEAYYRQQLSNGELFFKQTGTFKNKNLKGLMVEIPAGGRAKKAKKDSVFHMDVGRLWKAVSEKDVPKPAMKKFAAVEESLEEALLAELQGYTVPSPGDVGPGPRMAAGGYRVPKPGKVGPRPKKVKKAAYTGKWGKGYIDRYQRGRRGKDVLEPIEGYLRGVWGIAKSQGFWNVYHAPTGFMAWSGFDKKADAKEVVDAFLKEFPALLMLGKDVEPTKGNAGVIASKMTPYVKKIRAIADRVKGSAHGYAESEDRIEDQGACLGEGRPGPHWNPWPQRKTSSSEFVKSLEDIARINSSTGIWSKKTVDIAVNIVWAMKKDDKARVKKLRKMLANQSDVSAGLVNEIDHWLKGWMESVESGKDILDEAARTWSANGYLEIKTDERLASKDVKAIKRYVLRWANGSERAGSSMLPKGRRWKATDVSLVGGKLMVSFVTDAKPSQNTVRDIEAEVIGSDGFGGMLWQFAVHDVASEEGDRLQMKLYGGYYQTDDRMNPLRVVGVDISPNVGFGESFGEEALAILVAFEGADNGMMSAPQIAEVAGLDKSVVREELAMMARAAMVARTAPAADQWRLTHFGEACGKPHGKKKSKGKKAPKMMAYEAKGGYQAKTPLEKMVGEMVLGQSGMWLTKPQMKAVIGALHKKGIKEPKEGAYDDIAREVGKVLSKLMAKAA